MKKPGRILRILCKEAFGGLRLDVRQLFKCFEVVWVALENIFKNLDAARTPFLQVKVSGRQAGRNIGMIPQRFFEERFQFGGIEPLARGLDESLPREPVIFVPLDRFEKLLPCLFERFSAEEHFASVAMLLGCG